MVLMEGTRGRSRAACTKGRGWHVDAPIHMNVIQLPVPWPTAAGKQVRRQHVEAAVVMTSAPVRLQLASFCLLAATVAACCGGCASTAPANPSPPAAQLGSAAHCAAGKAAATWCTSGPTGLGGS